MNEVLHWHPKFNRFNLANHDVLLISETDSFNLSGQAFPFLNLIDGEKSLNQILMALNLPAEQSYGFLRNIRMLLNEQILLEGGLEGQHAHHYLNQTQQSSQIIAQQGDICLINASSAAPEAMDGWKTVFASVAMHWPSQAGLRLMLADSFLAANLPSLLGGHDCDGKHVCLVRVVEKKIWLMHLPPSATFAAYFQALQKRLLDNTPAWAFAKALFPHDTRCIPFLAANALPMEQCARISEMMQQQILANEASIRILDSVSGAVELHSIVLAQAGDPSFARQIEAPLRLNHCQQAFYADGGSRSIAPAETLKKLQPFISPITGVITHLHMLKGTEQHSIKIFSSAFFKIPAVKSSVDGAAGAANAANAANAALAEAGFVQRCLGKGVSVEQSQASALCEAIERYSALYQGDEPSIVARASALKQRHVDFQQLVPYSAAQYQRFADPNHPDARQKQAAQPYADQAIHWVSAWSLSSNEAVYLPLTSCFTNVPFEDDRFGRWHSNGCAAGNTLEEAILQGLFELIERDATAIWWYNRIRRPVFDMRLIPAEHMRLLDTTLSAEHEFWVLDLTNDIGVPVMAAIGRHKQTSAISFGFGCHIQAQLAAQRALTELCQLIPIREQGSSQFDFNAIEAQDYLLPAHAPRLAYTPIAPDGDIKPLIESIVARLQALGLETIALNYSRQPLPIKTAKVWVPGLAHIWPQYANCRLYQVPVSLGWLAGANTEASLNPQALFV